MGFPCERVREPDDARYLFSLVAPLPFSPILHPDAGEVLRSTTDVGHSINKLEGIPSSRASHQREHASSSESSFKHALQSPTSDSRQRRMLRSILAYWRPLEIPGRSSNYQSNQRRSVRNVISCSTWGTRRNAAAESDPVQPLLTFPLFTTGNTFRDLATIVPFVRLE